LYILISLGSFDLSSIDMWWVDIRDFYALTHTMDFEVNGQKEMSCALSQQNDYMLQDLENLLKYACSSKEGCL